MAKKPSQHDSRHDSFVHVLIGDTTKAFEALHEHDSQRRRRNAIRTMFSALEGLMWAAKSSLKIHPLTPAEHCVIHEEAYEVSERGSIRARPRFIPFDNNLKAVVRIVRRLRPEYDLDYNHLGWPALLNSLEVRHRLTHPKRLDDLIVTDDEIADAQRCFPWFLAFVMEVFLESNETFKEKYPDLASVNKSKNSETCSNPECGDTD